jgi:predicted O-methyltransferase YrrM
VLLSAVTEGRVFNAKGEAQPLHSNISLGEAETLYKVVRNLKPDLTAEVGFAHGISALAILKALDDNGQGVHHVVDPFQANFDDIGLAMVARAGLGARLEFHRQFAEEALPKMPSLQFAFIDSSHLFDLTLLEFVLIDKKLDIGGLISFHDMWMPSLQKLLRYILANRAYEIVRSFEAPKRSRRRTLRETSKATLIAALSHIPGKERLFREELLRPWRTLRTANLVVLRKHANDGRGWNFHQRF